MSDKYLSFVNSAFGKQVAKQVGLPSPVVLERFHEGQEFLTGPALVGTSEGGRLLDQVSACLATVDQPVMVHQNDRNYSEATASLLKAECDFHTWTKEDGGKLKALIFDASGIKTSADLKELYNFFKPAVKQILPSGRIVILGSTPELCSDPEERIAQRALTGVIKAMGKEMKNGGVANLIYVASNAEQNLASSLQFFLSSKTAYVSGQVANVYPSDQPVEGPTWIKPLTGKTALVTGAARGIGEAIARVLARDGAKVICLDVPQAEEELHAVADSIQGETIALDITAPDAPQQLSAYFSEGLDILVHNAGVTRDKTLGNMSEKFWDMVIDINLSSEERINKELLDKGVLSKGGRIICVSSVSGIAGNRGQVNYAASKAGVIGMVDAYAEPLASKGITINAVAPGFIETKMTAAMPMTIREGGRRLNVMAQGGLPVDVAEAIAWYAQPASQGVNGNLVRVCGLALIGA